MKKILFIFVLVALLLGCNKTKKEEKLYTLKYVIFYTNEVRDTVEVSNKCGYYLSSDRGTNYISSMDSPSYLYRGSAPYKIISYTVRTIKN